MWLPSVWTRQRPECPVLFCVSKAARGPLFCVRRNNPRGAAAMALLQRNSLCTMTALLLPNATGRHLPGFVHARFWSNESGQRG
jgi:hypothetical protein